MSDLKSLVELGKLTEPATALIEKISNAVGILYEPRRIIKLAEAQAHADLINFNSKKNLTDLEQRAIASLIEKEKIKQDNVEKITINAISSLSNDAKPEEISNDWLNYFFNQCEIITEPDMQRVWGEMLARKASSSTEYSKRTLSVLATLEPSDARLFTKFCAFTATIAGIPELLIYSNDANIYVDNEVDFGNALHIQSLGLIHFSDSGYALDVSEVLTSDELNEGTSNFDLQYFDKKYEISFKNEDQPMTKSGKIHVSTGLANFTTTGKELFRICSPRPNHEFEKYLRRQLKKDGFDLVTIIGPSND